MADAARVGSVEENEIGVWQKQTAKIEREIDSVCGDTRWVGQINFRKIVHHSSRCSAASGET